MSDSDECGHQWQPKPGDEAQVGVHRCIQPAGHESDITNDDHRCCCGASTWKTP